MPGGSRPCILIVEDEPLVADGLRGILDELDIGTCQVAQSVQDAVSAAYEWRPLLIIMDLQLRGIGDATTRATLVACMRALTTRRTDDQSVKRRIRRKEDRDWTGVPYAVALLLFIAIIA